MKNRSRQGVLIALVGILGMLALTGSAWADALSTLQAHDPTQDAGQQRPGATAATSTSSAQTLQEIIDEITKTTELIAKILHDLNGTPVRPTAPEASASGAGQDYIVQSGDSLWAIAERFLGDGSRYPELVEANKDRYPSILKNPDLIYPGWNLAIPGGSGSTPTPSASAAPAPGSSAAGAAPAAGSLQQRLVAAAQRLVGQTNFPYAPETNGGRLGCAQVATTALKNAGAVDRVVLGVLQALSDLRAKGWREVNVPPFQAGDVISWKTYDRTGDGVKDPDTHIGIIMSSGNNVQAMNNSSSLRQPRLTSANMAPISRVLRKPA
jgi:LysM repeat protein